MSLQIRMNGRIVDLSPGAKIELELVSPYLVYDDILSSKVTIPNLPASARNRAILGYPDLLQNDAVSFRYMCEKYYNGQLLQTGAAVLTEAGSEYSFTVVQALGEFFGAHQYKPLSEIDFGSLALPNPLVKLVNSGNAPAVCFPTIVNPDYYGSNGAEVSYSGKMNDFASGAYSATGPKVPFLFVDYLLGRIAAVTGTTITGDYFTTRPELRKLILFNTRALDRDAGPGASAVTISRHLPELTLAEFFLELRKLFNLSFTFSPAERKLSIGFTSDMLKRPTVKDWSEKALKVYRKQPETSRRLQLGSELDSNDGLLKDKPPITADYLSAELAEPTGIAPLKSKFSTLLMDAASGTATCKQAGVTATLNQSANKFGARLLFYTGGDANNDAPTASSTLGALSLYWTGDKGLARTFWTKNEELRSRWFYLARNMTLNEFDLASLDFSQKVHINGVNYLPLKVIASLPVRAPAQVLFIRV
ncbi:hypothetical protein CLV58_101183 [Spirosoma oryzae]|uniref:Uncharacterized protein n=1 Tax=Spirosoma oryzae TaxID=1469603 RepID=A0A2T0TN86_9BACT|nr:hypothetical protein [Spirosoma oryzae]PRY47117.1 hypothetical protein CLV58_101183 [Spirosoma oryzae]